MTLLQRTSGWILGALLAALPAGAQTNVSTKPVRVAHPAATWSVESSDLVEFAEQPEAVRELIEAGLALTRRHLTYTYGSADPARGGMDCSGFVFHTLQSQGIKDVPRSSSEQAKWLRDKAWWVRVSEKDGGTLDVADVRPGDLLFWEGTYAIQRDPPVTHAMIYLGRRKADGKPLMMGSSDGRVFDGNKAWGVSVFDFKPPGSKAAVASLARTSGRFYGFGSIPKLRAESPQAFAATRAKGTGTVATRTVGTNAVPTVAVAAKPEAPLPEKKTSPPPAAVSLPTPEPAGSGLPQRVWSALRTLDAREVSRTLREEGVSDEGRVSAGVVKAALTAAGVTNVPATPASQWAWFQEKGRLRPVDGDTGVRALPSTLPPGSVIFWSKRRSPEGRTLITHSEVFAGYAGTNGAPVSVGTGPGRSWQGETVAAGAAAVTSDSTSARGRVIGYALLESGPTKKASSSSPAKKRKRGS